MNEYSSNNTNINYNNQNPNNNSNNQNTTNNSAYNNTYNNTYNNNYNQNESQNCQVYTADTLPKIRVAVRKRPFNKKETSKNEMDIIDTRSSNSLIVKELK